MSINIYRVQSVYLTGFKVKGIKSKINKYNNNNTNKKHEYKVIYQGD